VSLELRDAQGGSMPHKGIRCLELDLGEAVLKEQFVVTSVGTPLLAFGKMLRQGWKIEHEGDQSWLNFEDCWTPVYYKKNTPYIQVNVRAIHSVQPQGPHRDIERNSYDEARPIIRMLDVELKFDPLSLRRGWQFSELEGFPVHPGTGHSYIIEPEGFPVHLGTGRSYLDPTSMMSVSLWKFRTTLVKIDGQWKVCDFNEQLETLESLERPLPEVTVPVEVITIMTRHRASFAQLGMEVMLDEPSVPTTVQQEIESDFQYSPDAPEEPMIPETPLGMPDDAELSDIAEERLEAPPAPLPGLGPDLEGDSGVIVEGINLNADSSASALRQACSMLGCGQSGSKQVLLKRLKNKLAQRALEDQLALSNAALPDQRSGEGQAIPHEPNEAERALHELTHIPFKSWCPACIAGRARRDHHQSQASRDAPERSVPVISMDWFYVKGNDRHLEFMNRVGEEDKEPVLTVLACIDRSTGMMQAIPVPNKKHDSQVYAAKQVLTFISYLSYADVQLRHDNEPVMQSLADMICKARARHGLATRPRPSQPYVHESNGVVEQAVQNLRDMAVVHLEQVREHAGQSFSASQDIVGWALVHGAFLHKFVKMLFLGCTIQNNMYVCGNSLGVYLSSTIRRLPPSQQWAGDLLKAFKGKTWKYGLAVLGSRLVPGLPRQDPTEASAPVSSLPAVSAERKPQSIDPGPDEAASEHETEKSSSETSSSGSSAGSASPVGSPDVGASAAASHAPETPEQLEQDDMEVSTSDARSKRTSSAALLAPSSPAGEVDRSLKQRVQHVIVEGEELFDLDEKMLDFEADLDVHQDWWFDAGGQGGGEVLREQWAQRTEDEGPPPCSEEELQTLDLEAEAFEAERLLNMKVLEPTQEEPPPELVLNTRYVHDWRFRNGWVRRARLVSKELKVWDPHRMDVFAPSTCPAMIKLVPALFAAKYESEEWYLWSIDFKDAFLTVPQRSLLYVKLNGQYFKVLMCLPGQRQAGAWWSEQITTDVLGAGLENPSCPVAFGNGQAACALHVDDGILGGRLQEGNRILEELGEKYVMTITGPIRNPGEQIRFLKRLFVIEEAGLAMYSDPKYLQKMAALLGITRPRMRKVPCTPEWCTLDCSSALDAEEHALFRSVVGCLLYLAPDRCDVQFAVSVLARKVQNPTQRDMQFVKHLVEYLLSMSDYHLVMKWTTPGKSIRDQREEPIPCRSLNSGEYLLEVLTDSDWAGSADRKSNTSVHVYLNSVLVHSFVRKQDTIALSSRESELISAVSGCADGLYIKSIVETMTKNKCTMIVLVDNASARLIMYKTGTSRVRHLDCRLLWVQSKCKDGILSVKPIPTRLNTSDAGTKPLSAERLRLLLGIVGYHSRGGVLGAQEFQRQEYAHNIGKVTKSQRKAMLGVLMVMLQSEGVHAHETDLTTSSTLQLIHDMLAMLQVWIEMFMVEKDIQSWMVFIFVVIFALSMLSFFVGVMVGRACFPKETSGAVQIIQKKTEVEKITERASSSSALATERLEPAFPVDTSTKIAVTKFGTCYHRVGCKQLKNFEVHVFRPRSFCIPTGR